jgi:hypothetical protein
MISARFCVDSDLEVRWPATDEDILTLCQTFVAWEGKQPPAQQLKDISATSISARLAPVLAAMGSARTAEVNRTAAAETFKAAYTEARTLLDKCIVHLSSKYVDDLAQVGLWGLETKVGPRGLRVIKPTDQAGWIKFLNGYVAREQALPEAQQIANLPLSRLVVLAKTINNGLITREAGVTSRRTNVRTRVVGAQELLELLQVACITLIYTRFGGQILPDLANWGYTVVGKQPAAPAPEPPAA